jgi:hypothetical protein
VLAERRLREGRGRGDTESDSGQRHDQFLEARNFCGTSVVLRAARHCLRSARLCGRRHCKQRTHWSLRADAFRSEPRSLYHTSPCPIATYRHEICA